MIRIIAKEYNLAVASLCTKLNKVGAVYDVYTAQDTKLIYQSIMQAINFEGLFLVGNVSNWCNTFAETFSLSLVYDKFAEQHIKKYCTLSGLKMPAQYQLDKLCQLPETFIHYASVFGPQCACGGQYGKCHIYIMPDDTKECEQIFDNYISKDLFKFGGAASTFCFKLFGLSKHDLEDKLGKVSPRIVSQHCETENLDSKVVVTLPRNCSKKTVAEFVDSFMKEFEGYVYAKADQSLAQTVVQQLNERYKTVAMAESVTGGLIASSMVEIPGASNVLYEGVVAYTIDSKSKRLGISPHFIDAHGVVSAQVASSMAIAQLQNADYSISTTGFAGPLADGVNPVGLCFIGIGAKLNGKNLVKVYKNIFTGDRNSIRMQVANTALYLLSTAMTNPRFFS